MITQDKNFDPALIWLPAITHWKVLTRHAKETLVEVHTETGRTQQIRVHFASIGHALVGDHLYSASDKVKHGVRNPSPFVRTRTGAGLGRIFLHATRLQFTDLNDEIKIFEASLPPELETYLKKLK